MNTFITYRSTGDLQARIQAAVTHFHQERGALPASVTVHKSETASAQTAMQALGLAVAVAGSGGCLVGETWLALAKDKPATEPPDICPICGKPCDWRYDGIQHWPWGADLDLWTSVCCGGTDCRERPGDKAVYP